MTLTPGRQYEIGGAQFGLTRQLQTSSIDCDTIRKTTFSRAQKLTCSQLDLPRVDCVRRAKASCTTSFSLVVAAASR